MPGKRSHYRVFCQKCLTALGTLPVKCVTGYSEMMGPLSQFLFGLVMLGTLPGNLGQKWHDKCRQNTTQNRRKSMFRDDFWGLGDPWGALGRFLGPFGPKSVFRTGKHGSLDPLWAPLADPKIDRKSLKFIHVDLFVEKCVPKQVHQQDHFLFKLCAILVTPEPCFLSSRLHGSTIFKTWPDH